MELEMKATKIINRLIYLSAEVDHVGISIIEREHDTVGRVQFDHDDRVV